MGRILQPIDFALFSSIMALFAFFSAPMSALSMLIVRKVAVLKAHENLVFLKSLFFSINKLFLIFAIIIFVFIFFFSSYLQHYLKANSPTPIILFAFILVISFFTTACMAFMQGLQRFAVLGVFGLLGLSSKFLIGVVLVKLGLGAVGALLGVFLAMILVYLSALLIIFRSLPPQIFQFNIHLNLSLFKRTLPVLIATLSFAAMSQLDMVLVNWYFSPQQAANYAAASVLGKAVLYLPGGLILALFPMVSEDHAKGGSSFGIFRQAALVTLVACGSISGIYWLFGDSIISILYGDNYKGAGEILRWYGFAILPLAIVLIAEQYLIAKGQVLFAWIFLILLPLELLAIYIWHSEVLEILIIMGIFGSLLAIIGYGLIWRSVKFN